MKSDEAIKHLNTYSTTLGSGQTTQAQHEEAKRMAIKALEAWEKVIEEIQQKFDGCDICEWIEDYDWDENNISEYRQVGSVGDILDIINKNLGEVEG